MKVADKRGKWFTNTTQFRMHDPMSDTYFESGEPTKATVTDWLAAQSATIPHTDEDGVPIVVAAEPAEQPAEQAEEPEAKVDTSKKK